MSDFVPSIQFMQTVTAWSEALDASKLPISLNHSSGTGVYTVTTGAATTDEEQKMLQNLAPEGSTIVFKVRGEDSPS